MSSPNSHLKLQKPLEDEENFELTFATSVERTAAISQALKPKDDWNSIGNHTNNTKFKMMKSSLRSKGALTKNLNVSFSEVLVTHFVPESPKQQKTPFQWFSGKHEFWDSIKDSRQPIDMFLEFIKGETKQLHKSKEIKATIPPKVDRVVRYKFNGAVLEYDKEFGRTIRKIENSKDKKEEVDENDSGESEIARYVYLGTDSASQAGNIQDSFDNSIMESVYNSYYDFGDTDDTYNPFDSVLNTCYDNLRQPDVYDPNNLNNSLKFVDQSSSDRSIGIEGSTLDGVASKKRVAKNAIINDFVDEQLKYLTKASEEYDYRQVMDAVDMLIDTQLQCEFEPENTQLESPQDDCTAEILDDYLANDIDTKTAIAPIDTNSDSPFSSMVDTLSRTPKKKDTIFEKMAKSFTSNSKKSKETTLKRSNSVSDLLGNLRQSLRKSPSVGNILKVEKAVPTTETSKSLKRSPSIAKLTKFFKTNLTVDNSKKIKVDEVNGIDDSSEQSSPVSFDSSSSELSNEELEVTVAELAKDSADEETYNNSMIR